MNEELYNKLVEYFILTQIVLASANSVPDEKVIEAEQSLELLNEELREELSTELLARLNNLT